MALIKKDVDGNWVFRAGKYQGNTLEDVAEKDPGYLLWAWRTLSEEEDRSFMDVVEDVLNEHDIEIP